MPAAGAVHVPLAAVTDVALGWVMAPAQRLPLAATKGADRVPAFGAVKEPGYEAPTKPAAEKPSQGCEPLSCSV